MGPTLELNPELEDRLRREAENRGIAPKEVATQILDQNPRAAAGPDVLGLATSIYDGLDKSEIDEL